MLRFGARMAAPFVILAASCALSAGSASADIGGPFCPPDGTTMTIAVGDTCVHGRNHVLTQVDGYRLNNTAVTHCAGGNSTTSASSYHVIGYVCGIGASPNGWVHTPYHNPGTCAFAATKNDGPTYVGGFYGNLEYINDCV